MTVCSTVQYIGRVDREVSLGHHPAHPTVEQGTYSIPRQLNTSEGGMWWRYVMKMLVKKVQTGARFK